MLSIIHLLFPPVCFSLCVCLPTYIFLFLDIFLRDALSPVALCSSICVFSCCVYMYMCGFVVPVGSSSLIVMGDTVIDGRAPESQCCIGGVCGPGLCSSCLIGIGVALRRVTLLVLVGLYMSFIVAAILQSGGYHGIRGDVTCPLLRSACRCMSFCTSISFFLSMCKRKAWQSYLLRPCVRCRYCWSNTASPEL